MAIDLELNRSLDAEGTPTLAAAGEIDMSNVESFRRALTEAAGQAESLVVDLRSVDYLDSAAVAALFAQAAHTRIELVVNDVIAPVIKVSGLSDAVTMRT